MPEPQEQEAWHRARLFSTVGINGAKEQEPRATSALLSVLPAVPSFGRALLKSLDAPTGSISSFTEVRLQDGDGVSHVPDGAIVIEKGSRRWSALVEVKTGRNEVPADQVVRYLDLARRYGFDALFTISNQIVADPEELPYKVKGQKIGKLTVRHLSWWQVLTEAIIQHRFRGVDDPDQAWTLGELIRFLTDERSGASGFLGMGESWVKVRDGARDGTLPSSGPEALAASARWEQLIEYLCLNLSQELGVVVRAKHPRGKKPAERVSEASRSFAENATLCALVAVPGAVGPLELVADLKAKQLTTSVPLDAPGDGKRALTKISWLLRQLHDAPDDLRIEVRFPNRKTGTAALLRDCREDPSALLLASEPACQPRSFVLALTQPIKAKSGTGPGSFVEEVRKQTVDFYRDLVQELKPPPPSTPKLPDAAEPEPEPPRPAPAAEAEATEGQVRREHGFGLQNLAGVLREVSP
jgi:hypothetical protein